MEQPEAPKPDAEQSKAYWKSIQDERGVDVTLIRSILKLSPSERLRRADRARRSALRLMELGKKAREERRKSP
jgi:hypothetical protein